MEVGDCFVIARRYEEAIFGHAAPHVILSIAEGSVRVPHVDASTPLSMTWREDCFVPRNDAEATNDAEPPIYPSMQNHGESNAKVCFSYGQHPFSCFFPASILLQIRTRWVPEQNMFPYQQTNIDKWDKIPSVQTYPAPPDTNLSTIATALYRETVKNVHRGSWKYGWEVPIFAPLRKGGTAGWPLK